MGDTLENKQKLSQFLIIAGIIVVAFNLRPAITSVGPLISTIRDELGMSNWSVGLLTSLPLVAFAIMSPLIPRIANRYTNERVMLAGLVILLIGISVRSFSLISLLFLGTLLVGIGIAICNVLLPGVIKEKFPLKVAFMTSVYSTSMGIFAAAASGLSIPLANNIGLGWQWALTVWALPALVGIFIWASLNKQEKATKSMKVAFVTSENNAIWKSALAWQVAAFMGLQSFLFYVTISWLPEILHQYGLSMSAAGWMLSIMQLVGLPASFLVPVIAGKLKSQRPIVIVNGVLSITGYTGLLMGESYLVMSISTVLIGITLSGTFALALTFLGMRAKDAKQAAALSGMAQSLGYLLAAVGPLLIGLLYDLTHSWSIPLLFLIGVSSCVVLFGMGAGRNKYVLE
ncbi:CynX/NimT family MFS transporter [Oceanobacillus manasiensis]|uniref:CynX/NimT family MFS transporter n=1 Tax=Oceanobacillus manasiensis TaxID=586413 RepID=UPI0005AB371A|nr:MFS transporter [Oceanobacillus manasiensis]